MNKLKGAIFILWLGLVTIASLNCGTAATSSGITAVATASLCLNDPTHASGIEKHYHAMLGIVINGTAQAIPANTGAGADCMHAIHVHDAASPGNFTALHVETPDSRTVYLKDFFTIWGKTFNSTQILDSKVDATHEIIMTVNDKANTEYENYAFPQVDDPLTNILITYRQKS